MDLNKIKVIEKWSQPKNCHDLRIFITMFSCYKIFIEKFSILAGPFHDLTKKKAKFQWTTKDNTTFLQLKDKLMSKHITQHFWISLRHLRSIMIHAVIAQGQYFYKRDMLLHLQVVVYFLKNEYQESMKRNTCNNACFVILEALSFVHTLYYINNYQSNKYYMLQAKLSDKKMR